MKIKIIGVLVALGVLSSLTVGCGQGATSSIKGIMELLPYDVTQFMYMDIKALRADPDYRDIYDEMRYDISDGIRDEMGQYFLDVDAITWANDKYGLIEGDFDFDDFRYAMEDNDYDEGVYRGVEIWSDGYDAYALINNMIVYCTDEDDIRQIIRLSKGSGSSMYDNEDYTDVLNRIPSGVFILLTQDEYEEYRCGGISLGKVSGADDILEFIVCAKFGSERRAEENMRDLEEEMEGSFDLYVVDARQSGEFIIITAEIDMADISGIWD